MHNAALQRALLYTAILQDVAPVATRLDAMRQRGQLSYEHPEDAALLGRLEAIDDLRAEYLRSDLWGQAAALLAGEGLSYLGLAQRRTNPR